MAYPIESLPPDVVEAWKSGNKIEAIRRLREATGLGLAEAKAAVDALDRETGPSSRGGMERPRIASGPPLPEMLKALQEAGALPPDVLQAWQRGEKLEALKRFAAAAKEGRIQANIQVKTKVNGREGKRFTLGPRRTFTRPTVSPGAATRPDGLSPGEVPRSKDGAAAALVLVAIVVFAVVAYIRYA